MTEDARLYIMHDCPYDLSDIRFKRAASVAASFSARRKRLLCGSSSRSSARTRLARTPRTRTSWAGSPGSWGADPQGHLSVTHSIGRLPVTVARAAGSLLCSRASALSPRPQPGRRAFSPPPSGPCGTASWGPSACNRVQRNGRHLIAGISLCAPPRPSRRPCRPEPGSELNHRAGRTSSGGERSHDACLK